MHLKQKIVIFNFLLCKEDSLVTQFTILAGISTFMDTNTNKRRNIQSKTIIYFQSLVNYITIFKSIHVQAAVLENTYMHHS